MGPPYQRFDRPRITPDDRLDAAVAPVSHPALEAVLERLQAEGVAESDPLHDPMDRQVRRCHLARIARETDRHRDAKDTRTYLKIALETS